MLGAGHVRREDEWECTFENSLRTKEGGATAAAKLAADPQSVGIVGPSFSGAEMLFLPVFRPEGDLLVLQARQMEGLTGLTQDQDGASHIGRQALRDTPYPTAGFQGLTGSLRCDRYGDCGAARFRVVRLDDAAGALAANVVNAYPPAP